MHARPGGGPTWGRPHASSRQRLDALNQSTTTVQIVAIARQPKQAVATGAHSMNALRRAVGRQGPGGPAAALALVAVLLCGTGGRAARHRYQSCACPAGCLSALSSRQGIKLHLAPACWAWGRPAAPCRLQVQQQTARNCSSVCTSTHMRAAS